MTSSTNINGQDLADHVGIYITDGEVLNTNLVQGYSKITPIGGLKILGFYEFNNNRKE